MPRPLKGESIEGTPVTHEEAAEGLGFSSVAAMERFYEIQERPARLILQLIRGCSTGAARNQIENLQREFTYAIKDLIDQRIDSKNGPIR